MLMENGLDDMVLRTPRETQVKEVTATKAQVDIPPCLLVSLYLFVAASLLRAAFPYFEMFFK